MSLLVIAFFAVALILCSIDPKPGYVRLIIAGLAIAAFVLAVLAGKGGSWAIYGTKGQTTDGIGMSEANSVDLSCGADRLRRLTAKRYRMVSSDACPLTMRCASTKAGPYTQTALPPRRVC